jgi:uncharacterized protein YndB with AHSA1/START domain
MAGDSAGATVFVAVPPLAAFEVFTREIDLWWRQGPKFRIAGRERGRLCFEEGPSGRLFETFGERTFEVGRVTAWDPPALLAFEWRGVNFKPSEKTLVEVRFAPQRDGTLVSVRHSGWAGIPDDAPVRHGQASAAFLRMLGLWWGELLTSLREHVVKFQEEPNDDA